MKTYDVICIGAGSGGLALGLAANRLGLKVLVIDKSSEKFGGECVHSGCIPSKALLAASRKYNDFTKAISYVKKQQAKLIAAESPDNLQALGIDVALGKAQFVESDAIKVGNKQFRGRKIVIATGSKSRRLEIENHGRVPVVTHEELFSITNPRHLVIVGGGPVGCEMAQAFSNLGIKVTLIEQGSRLLPQEEEFAGNLIKKKLEENGVVVCLESTLSQIDYGSRLHLQTPNPKTKIGDSVSHVLVAVGRTFDYHSLDLAKANIATDDKGYPLVNANLQTSNQSVVVVGDAARKLLFSHAAEDHARALLSRWLNPLSGKGLRNVSAPWVTFTDYQVTKFGLDPEEIKRRHSVRVLEGDFVDDDRAITDNYQDARYKLYIKRAGLKEIIVGGTVVAPESAEMAQELLLAFEQSLSLSAIRNKYYPYPSRARVWQRILLEDLAARKLNSTTKKIIRKLFRTFN